MNCRQIVTLFCAAAVILRADVTLRYTSDFSIPESVPAQIAEPLRKAMEAQTAAEMSVHLKGDKGVYKSMGLTLLMDFKKEEVTLLDTAGKRFGTVAIKNYPAAIATAFMPKMPDQARQAPAGFKMNFESSKNAKSETVQGIEGHTREVIIEMEGPRGPMAKTTMRIVSAGADQAIKFPAIWEYNGYLAWSVRNMNPVETMRPLLAMMPGIGDGLAKLIEEGAKEPALILKTELTMSMAMLGTEPVMHMEKTLTEISTAPIDDALFQIPTGFNEATISEIMQALTKVAQFMPAPPPPSTPAIQVSSGDQSARLSKKVDPVYPELAKSARIQGVVKFKATINADGTVSKLELISGHPLLIPAARDAVLQWVYRASPTPVHTDISVNFTLQD